MSGDPRHSSGVAGVGAAAPWAAAPVPRAEPAHAAAPPAAPEAHPPGMPDAPSQGGSQSTPVYFEGATRPRALRRKEGWACDGKPESSAAGQGPLVERSLTARHSAQRVPALAAPEWRPLLRGGWQELRIGSGSRRSACPARSPNSLGRRPTLEPTTWRDDGRASANPCRASADSARGV